MYSGVRTLPEPWHAGQDEESDRVMSMMLTILPYLGSQAYARNSTKFSKRMIWTKLKASGWLIIPWPDFWLFFVSCR